MKNLILLFTVLVSFISNAQFDDGVSRGVYVTEFSVNGNDYAHVYNVTFGSQAGLDAANAVRDGYCYPEGFTTNNDLTWAGFGRFRGQGTLGVEQEDGTWIHYRHDPTPSTLSLYEDYQPYQSDGGINFIYQLMSDGTTVIQNNLSLIQCLPDLSTWEMFGAGYYTSLDYSEHYYTIGSNEAGWSNIVYAGFAPNGTAVSNSFSLSGPGQIHYFGTEQEAHDNAQSVIIGLRIQERADLLPSNSTESELGSPHAGIGVDIRYLVNSVHNGIDNVGLKLNIGTSPSAATLARFVEVFGAPTGTGTGTMVNNVGFYVRADIDSSSAVLAADLFQKVQNPLTPTFTFKAENYMLYISERTEYSFDGDTGIITIPSIPFNPVLSSYLGSTNSTSGADPVVLENALNNGAYFHDIDVIQNIRLKVITD